MVKAPSLLSSRVGALSHSGVPSQTTVSSTSSYYKKKYKSWRKGKSTKHSVDGTTASGGTKHHGSLKQQLRGLIRLQQKKKKDRESNVAANDDERDEQQEQELQEKIDALQEQIQMREITEKERTNAKKSHKLRFIDRQRTTRLYQYYIKKQQLLQPSESKDNINDDLYRLALDQVYVAHFPLDRTSYVSLFNPSNAPVSSSDSAIISAPPQQQQRRTVMNNRLLHKMATQRQCIMERLHQSTQQDSQNTDNGDNDNVETEKNNNRNANTNKRRIQPVSWIHPSQYERIQHLTTWSTQLERTTFNITIVNNTTSSNDDMMESPELSTTGNTGAKQNTDDDRFHGATSTFNSTQQLLLQEQERIERELSALEETDQKERNQSTAKQYHATKATASVTKYNTNESDSSDEDHDDSDDEVDDANVDPLSRSVADDVPKETLEQRNDNRIAGGDDDDDEDDSDDSDSMESEQSSDSESDTDQDDASSSIDRNDNDKKEEGVSHDDVIATATNLRKMASQRGHASFHNNNNTRKSGNMEEEDDFFVALDEVDQKEPTSNVFANAKRDTIRYNNSSSNGIGDKSQGWATQKQLPGQFRKKQRRR